MVQLPRSSLYFTLFGQLYQLLAVGGSPKKDSENEQIIGSLSKMILSPVAEKLTKKRLLIVTEGALQFVPFGALSLPQLSRPGYKPLLVDHEIVFLPSVSTLAVLRRESLARKSASKTVIVIADPVFNKTDERVKESQTDNNNRSDKTPLISIDKRNISFSQEATAAGLNISRLPGTQLEAEKILSFVPPAESFKALGFAANLEIVASPDLSQYRIIHFATHGFVNTSHPELSGIILSLVDEAGKDRNGFLLVPDIFNLNLPAELVVLSACQTGLGKEIKGEGLIGLTRGFMYAGAARVVVSLWNVNDKATAELMVKFYLKILKEAQTPAAALRAAQVEMWQEGKYRSPFYWAPFVLQGEYW